MIGHGVFSSYFFPFMETEKTQYVKFSNTHFPSWFLPSTLDKNYDVHNKGGVFCLLRWLWTMKSITSPTTLFLECSKSYYILSVVDKIHKNKIKSANGIHHEKVLMIAIRIRTTTIMVTIPSKHNRSNNITFRIFQIISTVYHTSIKSQALGVFILLKQHRNRVSTGPIKIKDFVKPSMKFETASRFDG